MTKKTFDLDKIKEQSVEFSKNWQKKLSYLSESVSRSGMEGAGHWLKSHHQIDELKEAISDLIESSNAKDFKLIQVDTTLSSFVIPKEDLDQAEWYRTADALLESFYKTLKEKQNVDLKLLKSLLNELKFISQADEFHQRYQIQSIQEKVTKVYQDLLKVLDEFKAIERKRLSTKKEDDALKEKELETEKAQALAKAKAMEAVKMKEKRLAIIEEKKRKLAEKELLIANKSKEAEMIELNAKKAETERQSKLQDAYVDLQIEDRINQWSVLDIIEILQKKASEESMDDEIKFKITELKSDINHQNK